MHRICLITPAGTRADNYISDAPLFPVFLLCGWSKEEDDAGAVNVDEQKHL